VPDGIDILITHGPPLAHLDLLKLDYAHLLRTLWRLQPKLHVFGHVHDGAGTDWMLLSGLWDVYERTVAVGGGIGIFYLWRGI
jgi:hypothetical protein